MADQARQGYVEYECYGDTGYRKTVIVSAVLHVVALILLPVLLQILSKPKKFDRPHTFQLVSAPIPPAPQRSTPTPPEPPPPTPTPPQPAPTPPPQPTPQPKAKPPEPKPAPTPPEPKPPAPVQKQEQIKKETEADLSALANLLSNIPVPVEMSAPGDFKFHWYLNAVRQKIEQNWRPPTENRNLSVIVNFTINSDGTVSNLTIAKSSGDSTLDNLARRAVTVASPFGRLPPGFSGDKLDINLTLRPTRRA